MLLIHWRFWNVWMMEKHAMFLRRLRQAGICFFSSSGDIHQELIDQSSPRRISRRSKSPESFLTVEEYDTLLTRF